VGGEGVHEVDRIARKESLNHTWRGQFDPVREVEAPITLPMTRAS
jgi:hypothetical protein